MKIETMKENSKNDIASFYKIGLGIIAFLILASCFSRQLNGTGWDFEAYFKAAGRILSGDSPYLYERDFSYKYSPVVALPFTVFHLFSYDVARWVYAALHALLAIVLPYMLYSLLKPSWSTQDNEARREQKEAFVMGVFITFLATLRFIDSEFFVSQIGLWIIGGILFGVWLLQKFNTHPGLRVLALACISLASLVKIHTTLISLSFAKLKDKKGLFLIFSVFMLLVLIPNPFYWLDWVEHMKRSSFDLLIDNTSVNLQGFYPLAINHLGFAQPSLKPLWLALPFALLALFTLKRFTLEDLKSEAPHILLNVSIWMLLGFMASPLPWQYTYSVLWIMMPLSWSLASAIEKRWILGVALFLGFTPQGIIGKAASYWLEQKQSVFAAILIFWFVMLYQSKRLEKSSTSNAR